MLNGYKCIPHINIYHSSFEAILNVMILFHNKNLRYALKFYKFSPLSTPLYSLVYIIM